MHFQCKDIGGKALQKLILINLCSSISFLLFLKYSHGIFLTSRKNVIGSEVLDYIF